MSFGLVVMLILFLEALGTLLAYGEVATKWTMLSTLGVTPSTNMLFCWRGSLLWCKVIDTCGFPYSLMLMDLMN